MIFNIYIPRMLGSVTNKTVYDTFNNLNIGYVTDLNMFRRVNENHYPYYFAFIKLELYNTSESQCLKDKLNNNGTTTITYDEEAEQYWEIKKYIPKDLRQKSTTSTNNITNISKQIYYQVYNSVTSQDDHIWYCDASIMDNIKSYFTPTSTSFTKGDMLDIMNDYNELEKEIFDYQTDLKYDV